MAKKKTQKKPKGYVAKAPIRRLMDHEGADLVAADALDRLIAFLESEAAKVTKDASKITKADKRKRITAADVRKATR